MIIKLVEGCDFAPDFAEFVRVDHTHICKMNFKPLKFATEWISSNNFTFDFFTRTTLTIHKIATTFQIVHANAIKGFKWPLSSHSKTDRGSSASRPIFSNSVNFRIIFRLHFSLTLALIVLFDTLGTLRNRGQIRSIGVPWTWRDTQSFVGKNCKWNKVCWKKKVNER